MTLRRVILYCRAFMAAALVAASGCDEPRYQDKTERQWRKELQSADARQRLWAAGALDAMNAESDETREALITALGDSSVPVQVAAAKALADGHEALTFRQQILELLWRAASDSRSEARLGALETLGMEQYQHDRNIPILTEALNDPSPAIRATAAVSLGMFGKRGREATSALKALMGDSNDIVRHEVRDALTAITGHRYEH